LISVAKTCLVSFKDADGFRHTVEIEAEGLYEAAAVAARSFADASFPPRSGSELEIEVKAPAVTHTITMNRVSAWVNGVAKSPKDKLLKDRLKEVLAVLP
jgi:hypothetical protein